MIDVHGYAALNAQSPLAPFRFSRREVGKQDVLIKIQYCGICHSDVHQARDEWGGSLFPMVPGHEIVGTVEKVGASVKQFSVGQTVGVGCFVDSCRTCQACKKGLEQYCEGHLAFTYNGKERDGVTPTYGGYSTKVVVDQRYIVRIPKRLRPEEAAPLLCAGITTYSPLRHWGVGKNHRLAGHRPEPLRQETSRCEAAGRTGLLLYRKTRNVDPTHQTVRLHPGYRLSAP